MTLQELVEVVREYKQGNQEVMIYCFVDTGEWYVDVGIPSVYVNLGEVEGEFKGAGKTFEEAAELRSLAK